MKRECTNVGRSAFNLIALARKHGQVARATLAIVALWVASSAFAADDNQVIFPASSTKSSAGAPPAGGSLNTVTLVVGLALAGVGGWLVWRNRRGTPISKDLRALAIAETRSLGNRQFLVVATYEGKKFLLGVCPGSINLLTALPEASAEKDSRA